MANSDMSVKGLNGVFDKVTMQGDVSIVYDNTKQWGTSLHGAPVKITGDRTVGLCEADDVPYGTLIKVEHDGACLIGKGKVQAFKINQAATIGAGANDFTAGGQVKAAAGNIVVKTASGGVGKVLSIESDYGVKMVYVDLG